MSGRLRPTLWGSFLGAVAGAGVTFFASPRMCVDRVSDSFCGMRFLGWNLSSSGAMLAGLAFGIIAGGVIGFALGSALRRLDRLEPRA